MKILQPLLLFVFSLITHHVSAQDKIVLKTGQEITAFIIEKSDTKIKYRLLESEQSPVIILRTEKVEKVIFRNGTEIEVPHLLRMERRFGVNGGLIFGLTEESSFFKIGIDYFLTPALNFELNGLIDPEQGGGAEVGVKYFFDAYRPTKLKGYAGALLGASSSRVFIQVPFGIHFLGENGFDSKLGLRGFYHPVNSTLSVYSELTIGWRF